MINALIFSKDRPLQLRLLLESLQRYAPGVFNINILYLSSHPKFQEGYNKLINESILPNIKWSVEKDFKNQTREVINMSYDYFCFFTDDDIVFKPLDEQEIVSYMKSDPEIFCFAPRLGKNTTYCYTLNEKNLLVPMEETDKFIKWDWSKHYMDYGYPLSVDGHIFKTNDIKKLVNKVGFANPNSLEIALQVFEDFPKSKMAAYIDSRLVNSPTNMVQTVIQNRSGEVYGHTAKELNDKYLQDFIIDFDSISFAEINSCHQELKFDFVKLPQNVQA